MENSLADEDEKSRLKRILSVMHVVEHTAANGQYHWAVPAHQGLKSRFILMSDKEFQQTPIRQPLGVLLGHDAAKVLNNPGKLTSRHETGSDRCGHRSSKSILVRATRFDPPFSFNWDCLRFPDWLSPWIAFDFAGTNHQCLADYRRQRQSQCAHGLALKPTVQKVASAVPQEVASTLKPVAGADWCDMLRSWLPQKSFQNSLRLERLSL
jgi:hypothetical protein